MKNWYHKVDLYDEFKAFYNAQISFEKFKDLVIPKLYEILDLASHDNEHFIQRDIMDIEDNIALLATSEDEEEWDDNWNSFYDLCDDLNIWIYT
jgi:hypothetical protein